MNEWMKAHPTLTTVLVVLGGLDVVVSGLSLVVGLLGVVAIAATGKSPPPAAPQPTPPAGAPGAPAAAAGQMVMTGLLPLTSIMRRTLPHYDARYLVGGE